MKNSLKEAFNIENRTKYFIHLIVFLCIASIAVFALLLIGERALNKKMTRGGEEKPSPFSSLEIEAKGAIVWDVVNQSEIFAKNENEVLPLASLTKVMTALITESETDNSKNAVIKKEYLEPDGDSGLLVDDSWRISDLRDYTLVTSSNDGALAIAAITENQKNIETAEENLIKKFIEEMNAKAEAIGLSNSRFFNEHGLDRDAEQSGAYGSAKDMALLFEYALTKHPKMLEATKYDSLQFRSAEKVYNAKNTNEVVNQIPGLLASKTGYTDLAGGNLVIAYDAGLNRPIIVSILGSSQEGRFSDALKLVEASIKYINTND